MGKRKALSNTFAIFERRENSLYATFNIHTHTLKQNGMDLLFIQEQHTGFPS